MDEPFMVHSSLSYLATIFLTSPKRLYVISIFYCIHGYVRRSIQYCVVDWDRWNQWLWYLQSPLILFLSLTILDIVFIALNRSGSDIGVGHRTGVAYDYAVLALVIIAFSGLLVMTTWMKNSSNPGRPEAKVSQALFKLLA